MRVAYVISSLSRGGAEGVLAALADGLARRGHEGVVLTLAGPDVPVDYPLPPGLEHRPLNLAGSSGGPLAAVLGNLHRVRVLRRAIADAESDVVVGFMDQTNILTLLAAGRTHPVVVSERIHPAHHRLPPPWGLLRAASYGRARAVVLPSAAMLDGLPQRLRPRCRVIPNPVAAPGDDGKVATHRPRLLAAGRLEPQKGFDVLLRAFAALAPERPEWRLDIFGEGPQRADLEALAADLDVADRLRLPGFTPALGAQMRYADIFVLSSRYEGFPNVLCEAMAQGLPAVATDCRSGPADIMRPEVDGLLVPVDDEAALADALSRLMDDEDLRHRMGRRAPEVLERFSPERFLDAWEALLREVRR